MTFSLLNINHDYLLSDGKYADLTRFASVVQGDAHVVLKQSNSGDIEFIDLVGSFGTFA